MAFRGRIDMLLFLGLLSEIFGDSLIRAAFCLTKPEQFVQPEDVSSQVGSIVKHATLDAYAWRFTDDPLPIHPEADIHTLDFILQTLVSAGVIQPAEVVETQNAIEAKKGQNATILEILPASLSGKTKTFEQMQQEGWFPND